MENIAPVRALNRRSTQLLQMGFIVLAIGVLLTVVGALLTTILLIPRIHPLFWLYELTANALLVIGIVVIIVAIIIGVRALTRRKENDLAMLTGDVLHQSDYLDGRYSYIRNINRSGLGYIDAVLLGPPGALVFRILNNTGNYANEGANWLKQNKHGEWLPFSTNPTKEAVDDIQHLRDYLTRHRLESVPVFGIIVFTGSPNAVTISEKNAVVPISHLHTLLQNLNGQFLANQERISQETVTATRRLLLE
jgi:hypothetical protein